jgi:regulator of RNase E activity RraA
MIDPSLVELLRGVDTPTVCNAIETVEGRRGFDRFTRRAPVATAPGRAVVGFAVTARIRAAEPPREPAAAVRARRMDYYRAMAEAPRPAIAVIEDEDDEPLGAFWGEVNAAVHRGLGVAGVLTGGLVRDLGDLPPDFPILAGGVGPSHGFVHVTAVGGPVRVLGLAVAPGDLVHADRHGAAVVPPAVLPDLAEAIARVRAVERIVLDPARAPGFDFAAFEAAWAEFERART